MAEPQPAERRLLQLRLRAIVAGFMKHPARGAEQPWARTELLATGLAPRSRCLRESPRTGQLPAAAPPPTARAAAALDAPVPRPLRAQMSRGGCRARGVGMRRLGCAFRRERSAAHPFPSAESPAGDGRRAGRWFALDGCFGAGTVRSGFFTFQAFVTAV